MVLTQLEDVILHTICEESISEDDMATLRILKKMKKKWARINRRMIAEMYNTNEIFSSNIHEEIPIILEGNIQSDFVFCERTVCPMLLKRLFKYDNR